MSMKFWDIDMLNVSPECLANGGTMASELCFPADVERGKCVW